MGVKIRNLSGQKIGMLTLDELIVPSPYSKKAYRCTCECGNSCVRLEQSLLNKNTESSCGCKTKRNLIPGDSDLCRKAGKNRIKANANGSNISMTFRQGTIKSNTSGVQGVSWSKTAHKWHVYIGYQNYRCNLGFFDDLEMAKTVRSRAEQAIKDNSFEEFYYEIRGFRMEERNTKQSKKVRADL